MPTVSDKLRRFIEEAPAGAAFQYHLGNLVRDREATVVLGNGRLALAQADVEVTAALAYDAAVRGQVFLVQERVDDDLFAYFAVKASAAWTRSRWPS